MQDRILCQYGRIRICFYGMTIRISMLNISAVCRTVSFVLDVDNMLLIELMKEKCSSGLPRSKKTDVDGLKQLKNNKKRRKPLLICRHNLS